jgi:excisionase family DNA binding protein
MLTIEIRLLNNGAPVSLQELAERIAVLVSQQLEKNRPANTHAPPREQAQPRLLGVREATQLLSLGRSTVWRLLKEQRLQTVRIGGRTLIPLESVYELMNNKPKHGKRRTD